MDVGVDMNQPLTGGVPNVAAIDALATARAPWVRIGFVRDVWTGPTDATPRGPQNLTWAQAYDQLVDGFLARGVQVYALVSSGITSAAGTQDSDTWQTGFAADATAVVAHFKDRVRVFEIYNEPNNFTSAGVPALDYSPFAHLLARTYQSIKGDHLGDACWQVTLLSGPIYSGDPNNGGTGADFLANTYDAGIHDWGWEAIRSATGSYPLDGAGYHIYVVQSATDAPTINAAVNTNITGFASALQTAEGAAEGASTKKVWVSEIGWRVGPVTAADQANDMQAGFATLASSGVVPLAIWFSLQDFDANDQWGLFTGPPYGASTAKPSLAELTSIAATDRPALLAHVDPASFTVTSLSPSVTTHVALTVVNDGTRTWSESGANPIRLGAASGCPNAASTNDLAWSDFDAGGYAKTPADSRAYLAADVPPGGTATFAFDVTPASTATSATLGVRMVSEGEAWFGSTFTRTFAFGLDAGASDDGGGAGDAGTSASDAGDASASANDGGANDGGAQGGGSNAKGGCGCAMAPARSSGLFASGVVLSLLFWKRRRDARASHQRNGKSR